VARNERRIRIAGGALLAVATLATRIPFRSHTLFEFDSIDFAIALHRFNLREVTPHMPGYILHVILGRFFTLFTSDANAAFVWLSIFLSVGSVLLLWRAAAQLRGERVGIVAAVLWLTLPLFWFQGCVNAIYIEEAFWTSAILCFSIRLIKRYCAATLSLLLITYSLAGAARQSDLLFFFPAIAFVIWKVRSVRRDLLNAMLLCFAVTALWFGELLRESGGLVAYLDAARTETSFHTQSILFGGSFGTQWDQILKVCFNLLVALWPLLLGVVVVVCSFPHHTYSFVRACRKRTNAQFVVLLALPALLFYLAIFFMKAGYLLNVLPSIVLILAVLFDEYAIWLAESIKRRDPNPLRLTRPIITRNVAAVTGAVVLLQCICFFIPWPGTEQLTYNNENTRNSFVHGALNRYEHSEGRTQTILNRAFQYTNVSGIAAVDSVNDATYNALVHAGAQRYGTVIIASWWARWCYDLFPHATVIDIETAGHDDSLAVGMSHERERENVSSKRIGLFGERVFLLMRHDRADFASVSNQLHLKRLALPEYLDAYEIEDSTFHLHWGGRVFVRRSLIPRSAVPLVDTLRMPMSTPLKRADDSGSR
jgi:hypothetical protein